MRKYAARISFIFILVLGFSSATVPLSAAAVSCQQVHLEQRALSRDQIAAFSIFHKVPALETSHRVPVLLVNRNSVKTLAPLFENSMGIQVALQPKWKNDHGLLRVGSWVIDMDTPGARGFGEIHGTGLAWKDVQDWTARKNDGSSKIIEVLFSLTPAELQTAVVYQRVRRAAIYRVPFTFGGAARNDNYPNKIPVGGENCFSFCRGTSLSSQISFMQAEVLNQTSKNFEQLKRSEVVTSFLNEAVQKLATISDVQSAVQLNNTIVMNLPSTRAVIDSFAKEKSAQEQQEFLNWLVALETSTNYAKLLRDLEIGGGSGWEGSQNTRAAAILVHDVSASRENFLSPDYTLPGVFNTWRHQDTVPLREVSPEDSIPLREVPPDHIVALAKNANIGWMGKLKELFRW